MTPAPGDGTTEVRAETALEVLKSLKEVHGFDMLSDLCGVDYQGYGGESERFAVVYHLYSTSTNARFRVKAVVPESDPTVPSVTALWKDAEWLEREAYDMFGIRFEGHPDLRRILCPDYFQHHPLRKDYPLRGLGERERFPVYRAEDEP